MVNIEFYKTETDLLITYDQEKFLNSSRVAHLGTADRIGMPHVVPVCFVYLSGRVYIAVDEKPKRSKNLKRIRNILENPNVTLTADYYDDTNWSKLGWVMIRGDANIITDGQEFDMAHQNLRNKNNQLKRMELASLPVILIQVRKVTSWGNLSQGQ